MKDRIIIRKAGHEDLENVVNIFQKAIDVMNKNGILQWDDIYPSENILKEDISKGQMFLGEINAQIASVFVINQQCDEEYKYGHWSNKEAVFAIVHRLCVNPSFQKKGIGTQTMHIIEEMLRDEAVETIKLDAFSLNPYALRMYEKLGYAKVGKVNWRKGLFYLFEKNI